MLQALSIRASVAGTGPVRRGLLRAALAVLGAAAFALPASVTAQSLPDFTELVERVGPSVVNIRTTERGRSPAGGAAEADPSMEEFFRRFGIPMPGR